jgi:NAD(P)-dependent dehydrogenase (short-subunit alcohol dehydrogenase family)
LSRATRSYTYLLTNLLLDTMKRSSPARILNVASKGLLLFPRLTIEFDNLDGRRRYSTQHAYYHSKLAQVMFTCDLAERLVGSGVTVNCIRVTNVQIDPARLTHLGPTARFAYSIKRRMSITPERMAEAYVRLALDPEFERVSGKLFDEGCREVSPSAKSMDRTVWRRLWEVSAELTGLRQA